MINRRSMWNDSCGGDTWIEHEDSRRWCFGGGGGQSQPTTTTQINKTEMPEWVERESEANYKFAQEIANKPYQGYTGKTVADLSPTSVLAGENYKTAAGKVQDSLSQANTFSKQAGQGILGMDRAAYTNPYVSDVVNKSMGELEKSRQQSLMSNADKAIAAKAFGGSRSAVVDAVTNAETAQKAGLLSSQLYADAYNNASGLMQNDLTNKINASSQLTNNANVANTANVKDYTVLNSIGQQEQAQEQAKLDDAAAKWFDEQSYDQQRLSLLLSSMGMTPYSTTVNSQGTGSRYTPGTDYGSLGLGMGSLALAGIAAFSDERAKTDIERVGKDEATGIPIYAYRYKGDPKSYPKVVGPMAQDVEKVIPQAVGNVGGKKIVDGRVLGVLSNGW